MMRERQRSLLRGRGGRNALALLAVVFALPLAAELKFDTTHVRHEADFEATAFHATFPFRNVGEETVTIEQVQSSCGCTVPTLPQKTYAPGEGGELEADFTFGSRTGPQRKTIRVHTSEGITELLLEVFIPQKWSANVRTLFWGPDEERAPKTLEVDFNYGVPVTFEGLETPVDAFAVERAEVTAEGRELVVAFAPRGEDPTGIYRVVVSVTGAEGQRFSIPVYLRAL